MKAQRVYGTIDGKIIDHSSLWEIYQSSGKGIRWSEWLEANGYTVVPDLIEWLQNRVRDLRLENGEKDRTIIWLRKKLEEEWIENRKFRALQPTAMWPS